MRALPRSTVGSSEDSYHRGGRTRRHTHVSRVDQKRLAGESPHSGSGASSACAKNLAKIDTYFASDRLEDILAALDAGAEAGDESVLKGAVLLTAYSAGLGLAFLLAAVAFTAVLAAAVAGSARSMGITVEGV